MADTLKPKRYITKRNFCLQYYGNKNPFCNMHYKKNPSCVRWSRGFYKWKHNSNISIEWACAFCSSSIGNKKVIQSLPATLWKITPLWGRYLFISKRAHEHIKKWRKKWILWNLQHLDVRAFWFRSKYNSYFGNR